MCNPANSNKCDLRHKFGNFQIIDPSLGLSEQDVERDDNGNFLGLKGELSE